MVWMLFFWLAVTLFLWGFAFIPVGSESPEWLAAAKNACFGTLPNGLPDTFGWLTLVLGPLSLLAGILVVWWKDVVDGLASLWTSARGRSLLAMTIAFVVWEGAWVSSRIIDGVRISNTSFESVENGGLPDTYPRTDQDAPELDLINQRGERTTLASLKGKSVLLTFAFAHCQTVCPALIRQAADAMQGLEPSEVELVVITLDPWRDTPGSLPYLAKKWALPPNAQILSGDPIRVTAVLDHYKIPWKRDEKTGDIAHPALSYVLDAEGRIAYTFNNAPARWLMEAHHRLKKEYAAR